MQGQLPHLKTVVSVETKNPGIKAVNNNRSIGELYNVKTGNRSIGLTPSTIPAIPSMS